MKGIVRSFRFFDNFKRSKICLKKRKEKQQLPKRENTSKKKCTTSVRESTKSNRANKRLRLDFLRPVKRASRCQRKNQRNSKEWCRIRRVSTRLLWAVDRTV